MDWILFLQIFVLVTWLLACMNIVTNNILETKAKNVTMEYKLRKMIDGGEL